MAPPERGAAGPGDLHRLGMLIGSLVSGLSGFAALRPALGTPAGGSRRGAEG